MPSFTSYSWFLTGPTASGKSRFALEIAERLNAEIVAMDSMTLYRGMDIGTDKPSAQDRSRVPHHLVDIYDPWESASLDQYLKLAEAAASDIRARGRQPLFVGGTPLYLKACLRGIFEGPPADPNLRTELEAECERAGSETLHRRLLEVDPKAAQRIPLNDKRRIIRALEVFQKTGRPISEWQNEFDKPASPVPAVACIVPDRKRRHQQINRRVLDMLDRGLIDEVRTLLGDPRGLSKVARQAAGYEEISQFLAGQLGQTEMVDRIQIRTRQLSKRQMTWFRHLEECTYFPVPDDLTKNALLPELIRFFETGSCQNDANDSASTLADDASTR